MRTLEVYRREDGKWAWRLIATNGSVIATDGGQGYEHRGEAVEMAKSIVIGPYRFINGWAR